MGYICPQGLLEAGGRLSFPGQQTGARLRLDLPAGRGKGQGLLQLRQPSSPGLLCRLPDDGPPTLLSLLHRGRLANHIARAEQRHEAGDAQLGAFL